MYIDYARKGSTWVQILNVHMPKEKNNWNGKMKNEKKKRKEKKKNQERTCGAVVRRSGYDAMWATWTGPVIRRPLGWLGTSHYEIGGWLASALVDCTPHKLEEEREYHRIQKKKLLGIVGNRLLVGLLARALTSKPPTPRRPHHFTNASPLSILKVKTSALTQWLPISYE